ncbi:MAG: hypothetical protein JWQ60_6259, partial [Pseudonocardia sp.]|nr:hypothetical protein [Pseudonocardia sp.]
VNPRQVDRYRDRHSNSGAKCDAGDAAMFGPVACIPGDAAIVGCVIVAFSRL